MAQLDEQIAQMESNIKVLLVPKDPRDDRNVIVEIRAGTGGDEAGIFAADLFRMYSRYAENHNWKSELLSSNETGVGGFKEVIFMVKGKGAYSKMKYESGVHRVQRVPVTESQGRIHTSTATVAVLPEVDEVEIDIPDKDIEIDVYKSAGAGGQNVQKNATAVRIHHLPTGIIVQCQDERSQLQNRLRAMSILRARLYELEQEKQLNEQRRRAPLASGHRRAQRKDSHLQLPAEPRHRSPHQSHVVSTRQRPQRRPGRVHRRVDDARSGGEAASGRSLMSDE